MTNAETKTKRAPQQRAEETKTALLDTAIEMFSTLGYDGVSVRALEAEAKVQRGAVAYHFDGKETLWKRAIDRLLQRLIDTFQPLQQVVLDLDEEARLRAVIAAFVRYSAEAPELNRLMVQEGRHDSWRLDYIVDSFTRGQLEWTNEVLGLLADPHTYYIMIGASTFVFDVEHECRKLFDVDPTTDEFIREHANRVADLLLTVRRATTTK